MEVGNSHSRLENMKLLKVAVTREQLESLPRDELTFFIQACRMLNEINILHKLTIFSNWDAGTDIERKAQNSQSFFLITILAGKLWEGWELINKSYFGTKLSKKYHKTLPQSALNSLNDLKTYFRKPDNLIKKTRIKIAFHYDSEAVIDQIRKIPPGEVLEMYLSEDQGNSLYLLSTTLLINAILEWVGISDSLEAIDKFFLEILSAAKWFIEFLSAFLATIADRNIGWNLEKIEIRSPAKIGEIRIPYFVEKPLL